MYLNDYYVSTFSQVTSKTALASSSVSLANNTFGLGWTEAIMRLILLLKPKYRSFIEYIVKIAILLTFILIVCQVFLFPKLIPALDWEGTLQPGISEVGAHIISGLHHHAVLGTVLVKLILGQLVKC